MKIQVKKKKLHYSVADFQSQNQGVVLNVTIVFQLNETSVPEGRGVGDWTLSFSVLMTVGPLIRGGKKGAMMDASTRVMGMSVGKTACSMASVSMVSQKSSMCTSSETEYSGQVNCQ